MTLLVDLDGLLSGLDSMAAQRPVAAQIVAISNADHTNASDLAAILGADVVLAAKVMRLANSAYFGLSGNVRSLQFAVTVVGFNTVRSIATVALAGMDSARTLPESFWDTSLHLAASAGCLGHRFGVTTPDAFCLGLLSQLGAALLHQVDPSGHAAITASTDLGIGRFEAESLRFGFSTPQLTAAALEQWHFPGAMIAALRGVPSGPDGALMRTSYELAHRILQPGGRRTSLGTLSDGRVLDQHARGWLDDVRSDVQQLRAALAL